MKSRLLGGIAALVLAVIGAILLFVYVQGAASRAQAGLEPVDVLIVHQRVPAGTKSSELGSSIRVQSVPKSAVPKGALTNLDEQNGKVTAVDLEPGEQLLATRLIDPKDLVPGTVPVPDGLEEVTFLMGPERLLGGRIEAGDTVTVFTSFESQEGMPTDAPVTAEIKGWKQSTGILFHDVLVTAVQKASPKAQSSSASQEDVEMPNGSAFVTVARSDVDAAKMIFSAEYGSIWLAKQTNTTAKSDAPLTTFGGLY